MELGCEGKSCPAGQTCVHGGCASDKVNSATCTTPSACNFDKTDASGPVDAGKPVDATLPIVQFLETPHPHPAAAPLRGAARRKPGAAASRLKARWSSDAGQGGTGLPPRCAASVTPR